MKTILKLTALSAVLLMLAGGVVSCQKETFTVTAFISSNMSTTGQWCRDMLNVKGEGGRTIRSYVVDSIPSRYKTVVNEMRIEVMRCVEVGVGGCWDVGLARVTYRRTGKVIDCFTGEIRNEETGEGVERSLISIINIRRL
jgi:hypothetical protein